MGSGECVKEIDWERELISEVIGCYYLEKVWVQGLQSLCYYYGICIRWTGHFINDNNLKFSRISKGNTSWLNNCYYNVSNMYEMEKLA